MKKKYLNMNKLKISVHHFQMSWKFIKAASLIGHGGLLGLGFLAWLPDYCINKATVYRSVSVSSQEWNLKSFPMNKYSMLMKNSSNWIRYTLKMIQFTPNQYRAMSKVFCSRKQRPASGWVWTNVTVNSKITSLIHSPLEHTTTRCFIFLLYKKNKT